MTNVHEEFMKSPIESTNLMKLDSEEAVSFVSKYKDDVTLAFIDTNADHKNYCETIKNFQKEFPNIPLIAFHEDPKEEVFLHAIHAGAYGFILTYEMKKYFGHTINQVINGHHPISPNLIPYLLNFAKSYFKPTTIHSLKISKRESELLKLLSNGHTYAECANFMNISMSTTQSHIRNLYRKMNVTNQRKAIKIAHEFNLI
jgi:DNA-binding NarL/FixJ family response regulator